MRTTPVAVLTLALLAACSKDPATGPAVVTVRDVSGPTVGADVLFQTTDGSLLAHVVTDADGKATAEITRGALVTVAQYTPGDDRHLTTIVDVQPGDALVLEPPPGDGAQFVGSASVTYPGTLAGTDQYTVEMGCSASSWAYAPDPVSPPIMSTCGAALDAIGIAHSATEGIVGWATATDVPVTGTAPYKTATMNLGAWRTDLGTMALNFEAPPPSATWVVAFLAPRRGGMLWRSAGDGGGAWLQPPDPASVSLRFPRDFWSSGRLEVRVEHEDGLHTGTFVVNESSLADRTIDLAAAIPPRLSGLTLTETESGHAASWTQAAGDAGLDGTILTALWIDAGGGHWWRVVLPAGRTAFDFPTLPAALAAFLPEDGTAMQSVSVSTYDVSTAASYADFRSRYLALIESYPAQGEWTLRASSTTAQP